MAAEMDIHKFLNVFEASLEFPRLSRLTSSFTEEEITTILKVVETIMENGLNDFEELRLILGIAFGVGQKHFDRHISIVSTMFPNIRNILLGKGNLGVVLYHIPEDCRRELVFAVIEVLDFFENKPKAFVGNRN